MKDLAAILFVAVVLSAAIYMIWKENTDEEHFNSRYDRATKPGRMFGKRKPTASNTTKVVEDKRKPGHNS